MADTVEIPVVNNKNLDTIENLADKTKTSDSVLVGIMAAQGWKAGKKVSENVFKSAKEKFLGARTDGKE